MQITSLASMELIIWNILEDYNEDPLHLFSSLQLDPDLMYQSGGRYPRNKVMELWHAASKVIKDPCFGLLAAEKWHPSNLGTLGYALLMSTSLRETLMRLIRFNRVVNDEPFAEADLNEDGDNIIYSINYTNSSESHASAREDAIMAWLISILRVNFQKPFTPISVHFTHEKPRCAAKFYKFFQCPVYFDNPVTRLEMSLIDADKILPSANKELAEFSDGVMTRYLELKTSSSIIFKVRRIIVEHLSTGNVTVEKVAAELFMSKRKLQRLMQEEGTTFLQLINETRKDIAKQYVRDKDMDLTEIAFLLGFAEQSTFSRSFKRWTGTSPSVYRKTEC